MEPAQIQLILNVIGITGVSSLAATCYLLRKENQKLTDQLKHGKPGTPELGAAAQKAPAIQRDIRLLAADRRKGWVEGLTSAIS